MVLIYLRNGECKEIPDASAVEQRGNEIVCLDAENQVLVSFQLADVETYTANEQIAQNIKDEVCEDLTVIVTPEPV